MKTRKKLLNIKLNFPPSAQEKFNALMDDESWSYSGLAAALIKRYPNDMQEFQYCLVEQMLEAANAKTDN